MDIDDKILTVMVLSDLSTELFKVIGIILGCDLDLMISLCEEMHVVVT